MTHKATGYRPQTIIKVNWEAEYKVLQAENAKLRAALETHSCPADYEKTVRQCVGNGDCVCEDGIALGSVNEQLTPEAPYCEKCGRIMGPSHKCY